MIDGLKLAQAGRIGSWGLERLFAEAAALRDAGSLDIATIAGATSRLGELRRTRSTQWRPAA